MASPQPVPPAPGMVPYRKHKSMLVAYALWFLFAGFGFHRMYVGKIASGATMFALLVISFLLFWLGLGFITLGIIAIWELVDAFLIPGWIRAHNTAIAS